MIEETAVTQLRAQHDHGLHPLLRTIRATLPTLPGSSGTGTYPTPTVPGSAEKGLVGVAQSNRMRTAVFLSPYAFTETG
jgi:hypothetical protein